MRILDSESLGAVPGSQVSHIVSVYAYDLVAPTETGSWSYPVGHQTKLAKIPGLDDGSKYYEAKLFIDEKPVDLSQLLKRETDDEEIRAGFVYQHEFRGSANIKIHLDEYEFLPGPSGYLSARMRDLTHVAMVAFSCEQPLILNSTVYGLTTKEIKPDKTSNMVTFTFSGWMLPGDGFFIDWVIPPRVSNAPPVSAETAPSGHSR
jgi:hypothetical protein